MFPNIFWNYYFLNNAVKTDVFVKILILLLNCKCHLHREEGKHEPAAENCSICWQRIYLYVDKQLCQEQMDIF